MNESKILINPEIVSQEGLTTFWEACASCSFYAEGIRKWYKVIIGTKEERIKLRKKEGYTIISKNGDYQQLEGV